jgi:preprotein translocase subunit SecA
MRIFGSERIAGLMEKLGMKEGEPIENRMVSKAIENAQKRVEGHNFEIRKNLLDYDNVMNQQREVIYSLRRDLMKLPSVEGVLFDFVDELLDVIYEPLEGLKEAPSAELIVEVNSRLLDTCNIARKMPEMTMSAIPSRDDARAAVEQIFEELREESGHVYNDILRYFLLEALDRCWKEHLRAMDYLREGIGLRGYAQRDPKREYQSEGLNMFKEMLFRIHESAISSLTHVRMKRVEEGEEPIERQPGEEDYVEGALAFNADENGNVTSVEPVEFVQAEAQADAAEEVEEAEAPEFELRHKTDPAALGDGGASEEEEADDAQAKVGRNEPCPCGSGKKFKKCCGR